jgi:protein-S-isoprenylcysteine O-methyltransferase Ste14
MALVGGGVLLLSGGWTDPWIWAYLGAWGALTLYALLGMDDDLARERFSPPEPGADRLSLRTVRIIALAHIVVGALDGGRWHLSPVGASVRATALVAMTICGAIVFYAMRSNYFFSPVVRVQRERGHRVVDRGPYAVVRHPGYFGMLTSVPLSGVALDSWIACGVGLIYSALVLRRVWFEDAFLREHLEGYRSYTERVRYRLIPGVF